MNLVDLTGHRFGKLVVIARDTSRKGRVYWLCQCDCGNTCSVLAANLKDRPGRKGTKSCGCEWRKGWPLFLKGNRNVIEQIDNNTMIIRNGEYYSLFSPCDYELVKSINWCPDDKGRFATSLGRTHYKFHRVIMGLENPFTKLRSSPSIEVDHIDRDIRNNRRENLRLCSHAQNMYNRIFKGYYWNKQRNRFQASITVSGRAIHLGFYTDESDAANARIEAEKKYFSEFAPMRGEA